MDHGTAHNYKRDFESAKKLFLKHKRITKRNKELVLQFIRNSISEGLSIGRVLRYIFYLKTLALYIDKDFEAVSVEDIKEAVARIEVSHYAKSTKRGLKIVLRKYYKWLRGTEEYPPEVKWFRTYEKIDRIKMPDELLTEEELARMINAAKEPMLKAFISTLYESGCRISEILTMKLKQLKFDEYGALLLITGKTGFRRVRVFSSVPYLTDWVNTHPQKDDPGAWLWITRKNKRITYGGIYSRLQRTASKAGIKKKVNPHNFRHSRATFLANHLTEAQMKEYFGWVQGSDMASVYIHLSGRDVDKALFKLYGIATSDEAKKSDLLPKTCPRCKVVNQATNKFCKICGMPLEAEAISEIIEDDKKRMEADIKMDELIHDSEFKEFLLKKVEELEKRKLKVSQKLPA